MKQEPPADAPPHGSQIADLLHQRWVVLVLLFAVMGALGIPLLWMSRAFSTAAKSVLSVVVTVYTAGLVWIAWLAVSHAYQQIKTLW